MNFNQGTRCKLLGGQAKEKEKWRKEQITRTMFSSLLSYAEYRSFRNSTTSDITRPASVLEIILAPDLIQSRAGQQIDDPNIAKYLFSIAKRIVIT